MGKNAITRSVILVYQNDNLVKEICNKKGISSFSWLFLSDDAPFYVKIRNLVKKDTHFFNSADDLQRNAKKYKQDYVEYVGAFSQKYRFIPWFLTSFSEKNPFISKVFLNFCYVKLFEEYLKSSENMVVVCGSRPLMNTIVENFSHNEGISIEIIDSKLKQLYDKVSAPISGCAQKSVFLARYFCRILCAKIYSMVKSHNFGKIDPDQIVIHSWTDDRSFKKIPHYTDVFFGDLNVRIKKSHPHFFYVSQVLPTIFYPKAVLKLSGCNDEIYLFEEFLSFADIFRATFTVLTQFPHLSDCPRIADISIDDLISYEIFHDRYCSSRSEFALLFYYAGKRLARAKKIKILIYTFENHMWEKMLCSGVHDTDRECQLIGYAHSVVSPMYLFYSLAEREQQIVPLPDIIMVNGSLAGDRLYESGFKSTKMVVSGAFRYQYLRNMKYFAETGRNKGKKVLVIPTSGFNETLELIYKMVLAFEETPEIAVIIKPHPTVPEKTILSFFSTLPRNFTLSFDPVENLLATSDLVIFTESAVSVEALACHIPILHIKSDLRIDMNLFEGIELIPSKSDPEEIKKVALELLKYNGSLNEKYDTIVNDFFAPVNETFITLIGNDTS